MKEQLKVKTCEEIMTTIYKPIEFYVENLIAQGLYILAGAPKVGKSWLSLDICLSIAKGEKVLGQQHLKVQFCICALKITLEEFKIVCMI